MKWARLFRPGDTLWCEHSVFLRGVLHSFSSRRHEGAKENPVWGGGFSFVQLFCLAGCCFFFFLPMLTRNAKDGSARLENCVSVTGPGL